MTEKIVRKKMCPECGRGEMVYQNFVLACNPPKFAHKCRECGADESYYDRYPITEIKIDRITEVWE